MTPRAKQALEHADLPRSPGHQRRWDQLQVPVAELPVLARADLDLLAGWQGQPDGGCEVPVPARFARQAAATPGAPAIVDDAGSMDFAELARRVDGLAAHLVGLGVAPEQRVGVMVRHGRDLLIAVLAVLRAGAAYVPLDAGHPAPYLQFIRDDAAVDVVISDARTTGLVPHGARVVLDVAAVPAGDGPAVRPAPTPGSLACVIYTSGSTGRPKGSLITHRGLANLACSAGREFALAPSDRVLMLAPATFSASLEELFPPLVHGAAAVFPEDRADLASVESLLEVLARHDVTVALVQTALWHVLVPYLAESGRRLPAPIRLLVIGGERVLPETFRQWRELGVPLVHVYGPTETTATATYWSVAAGGGAPQDRPPIGRPIANTRVFVTDERMHLVPPGTPGELYIGGAALARGYHGRPALTAERFVPDPFSGVPGAVLYRTGDLVRHLPGGELQFLDRVDEQVKIRGHRIEPADVEAALQRHPMVRQAAVVAREDVPGHRRLVGYVVAPEGMSPAELRRHLAAHLPGYMIPSAFVRLDAFPLTVHRKVDKAALPAPQDERPAGRAEAPRGELEEDLAALWSELLGSGPVGATDDFLDLGGDSLLTSRMLVRLSRRYGVRLTPAELFRERTVRTLARAVERARRGPATPPEGDVESLRHRRREVSRELSEMAGRTVWGPAAPAQQGLWFLSQLLADSPVNNSPWQCRLHGPLDASTLRQAAEEVARRHEVLASAFPEIGGQAVQVPVDGTVPEWAELDLRDCAEHEATARRMAVDFSRQPFDVAKGPLLRFLLLRLAREDHLLVCNVHHLVFDMHSLELVLGDLALVYHALRTGSSTVPDPPALQYADLSVRSHDAQRGGAFRRGLRHWSTQLAGLRPLHLPADPPQLRGGHYDGAVHDFWFPPELFARARSFGRALGASPFMVLLSAYFSWLRDWTGAEDIAVATPMQGRTVAAAEDVVGLFVVTAVLRADVPANLSFRQLVTHVHARALDGYAHQDVPLEQVMQELANGRGGARDLVRVLFSLQREPSARIAWPGMTLGPIEDPPTGTAKYDLSLILIERSDGVAGRVEYRSSLLDQGQAAWVGRTYCGLLDACLDAPDLPLGELAPVPAHVLGR